MFSTMKQWHGMDLELEKSHGSSGAGRQESGIHEPEGREQSSYETVPRAAPRDTWWNSRLPEGGGIVEENKQKWCIKYWCTFFSFFFLFILNEVW